VLRLDHGAIDPDLEQGLHVGGPQDGLAVLARERTVLPLTLAVELTDESNAARVSTPFPQWPW
jgi:hypothetical protein